MTKLQKVTLALALAVGLASLLPLPAWADWGPPTGTCLNPGGGYSINCFRGGNQWISCEWTCIPAPNCPARDGVTCPYVPQGIKCKVVPGC